ncbi:uncharacterized protein LOC105703116 [Orussus abietinus]|uniref:uncharacterized protein LOC105703116 n=1 Tax=Orussus abietinus TaxID=222816 RepID=UPI00062612C3|nr:uncharacterized protein LOC105703116 [Orussus abietinus]
MYIANRRMWSYISTLCLVLCMALFFGSSCATPTPQVRPVPGDCSKYMQCDAGGCFILSCGAGTEFNPSINTCDYPLMGRQGCGNRG